jgi:two-component system, sensor histidine kinase and response regulator
MNRVLQNDQEVPMPQRDSVTVLIVDDNEPLRYLLSGSLREGGYDVIEASNGAEALRMAEDSPDLITLDVPFPISMDSRSAEA